MPIKARDVRVKASEVRGVFAGAERWDEAAMEKRIAELEAVLAECVAVMSRSIYPKPDAPDDHPWSVLKRARELIEKANK